MALRPIVPGEPILASKVSGKDGRATLAALLPDARYIAVPGTHMGSVTKPELGSAIAGFLAA